MRRRPLLLRGRSIVCAVLALGAFGVRVGRCSRSRQPPKQAVVETTAGTFIIDLTPEAAPNQTAYFMKIAGEGGYDGTIFHRVIPRGMVQGGDPLSKDPAKRDAYGSGGLNAVKDDARAPKMTRGSVAAVTVPGKPDSAGAQFFIVLADQPALDGKYTVFGHVSDGMEVLLKISTTPVDAGGLATERVEIRKRHDSRHAAGTVRQRDDRRNWRAYRAVLDTSEGPITIEFFTDKAPNTVRQFMRMAAAGVYNGMAFHRVAPGFVIQTGARGHARGSVHREAAGAGPRAAAGVQRHEARQGDRLDGARRRSGQRHDVVLHLHGTVHGARRPVHRLRAGGRRHGGGRSDRKGAAQRRDAGVADRAEDDQDREWAGRGGKG